MTKIETKKYRARLEALGRRLDETAGSVEEQARQATGSAAGNLSNAPMHLGDIGTDAFLQELGATLLENEQYLHGETIAALGRLDQGTYGTCESCAQEIPAERLETLPYTRYCVACAAAMQAGRPVNLNSGRPLNWSEGIGLRAEGPPPGAPGGGAAEGPDVADIHAAGTPGGGTAIGGLAGTNIGTGEPDEPELEEAMGSSTFDVTLAGEHEGEDESVGKEGGGYAGTSGGAVGGTPANKRASGGRKRGASPSE